MHEEIYAGSARKIKLINDKVQKIEKEIEDEELNCLKIEDFPITEGFKPTLKFYYGFNNDNLIALYVVKGHETWTKEYRYYFDEEGTVIKYREFVPEGQVHKPFILKSFMTLMETFYQKILIIQKWNPTK